MTPYTPSLRALAKKTGSTERSIKKWLELEQPETEADAVAIIRKHQEAGEAKGGEIDPETGLTWFQAKTKEEAIRIRRENEREEKLESKELMPSAEHLEVLVQLCQKLEQIPFKAKSELGLNDQQKKQLQRMIDEARKVAADSIENWQCTKKPSDAPSK